MQASHNVHDIAYEQLQSGSGYAGRGPPLQHPPRNQRRTFQTTARTSLLKKVCTVCGQSHELEDCPNFKGFSTKERLEHLRKSGACFFCLEAGHSTKNCRIARRCEIGGCSRFHHKLLHEAGITGFVPVAGAIPRNNDFRATGPREGNVHASRNSENRTPHAIILGAIRLPV